MLGYEAGAVGKLGWRGRGVAFELHASAVTCPFPCQRPVGLVQEVASKRAFEVGNCAVGLQDVASKHASRFGHVQLLMTSSNVRVRRHFTKHDGSTDKETNSSRGDLKQNLLSLLM